jgi:crotonobetainyl-CoA:carnitine CoA-transferase CaiB-like acyl-CoA transferase
MAHSEIATVPMQARAGALHGIRVLDFSQFMAGPLAAQRLGDYGADVIKVELPKTGEGSRHASASNFSIMGDRVAFVTFNRNKRSITLNLKNPEGLEICRQLIKTADVMIENFRPGVMERLGLGYKLVSELNRRIIYGSITGYGPTGPYKDFPGQDLLVQSLSGMVHLNGRAADPPTPVGTPIIDATSGQQLTLGIIVALFNRERTGEGQQVQVSLLDTAIDLQAQEFTTYLNCKIEPSRSAAGIAHPHFAPPYGIYATKEGYLALAHTPMSKLAECLGLPKLNDFSDGAVAFDHRDEIFRMISKVLGTRTTQQWLEHLRAHDFWCGPVKSYSDLANDPQVKANDMILEVPYKSSGTARLIGIPAKLNKTPGSIRRSPPSLGQHNAEVFGEMGFSSEQIEELHGKDVI